MPVDLPTLPNGTPRPVQTAFERLKTHFNELEAAHQALKDQVATQPAPLTLPQINAGLSSTGPAPLNLTGLVGAPVVSPTPTTTNPIPNQPPPPATGGGGIIGGVDDGLGAQGCATAGSTGHVPPGTELSAITAGQIVCGTASEFPALLIPTVDQATRDSNQTQLLLRMIWHLQQAGFTAGRQRNPSLAISGDKLTVQVSGVFRAYDVFPGVNFDAPLGTQMLQVFPADYVADPGIAD